MKTPSIFLWQKDFPFFRLEGNGSKDFLHGQTTSDVKKLPKGHFVRSCWLDIFARVQALFEIRIEDEGVGLIILAGAADEVFHGFSKAIFPADQLEIVSFAAANGDWEVHGSGHNVSRKDFCIVCDQ